MVRLHLGCGKKLWDGWVNVDGFDTCDVTADLRKLPFSSDYADEAAAIHVLEHFEVWEAEGVLREWYRVLKPGGKLVMEMPDLEKIIALFLVPRIKPQYTLGGLYGNFAERRPEMTHKWCWDMGSLHNLLKSIGFREIRFMEPEFHVPVRDFRVECVK